jgi:enoyl-CoA hydratase/carnithine racemase
LRAIAQLGSTVLSEHKKKRGNQLANYPDIGVEMAENYVGTIEIRRPPHNFFDVELIQQIAEAMEEFDKDDGVRAVVLCAQGKSFCAGANFNDPDRQGEAAYSVGGKPVSHLYEQAARLLSARKPIIAAVHGAAIGGGLGVACVADFRVTCPEARFAANFTRLGFHPGFGLTVLLSELVGKNQAELMFYTGRRIGGEEAARIGLANLCVPQDQVRTQAVKLAAEIAECAPLAIISTRRQCAVIWRIASRLRPPTSRRSKLGCAPPKTLQKALRHHPNVAPPTGRADEWRVQ